MVNQIAQFLHKDGDTSDLGPFPIEVTSASDNLVVYQSEVIEGWNFTILCHRPDGRATEIVGTETTFSFGVPSK